MSKFNSQRVRHRILEVIEDLKMFNKRTGENMNTLFETRDIQLVAERIRQMLKNGGIGSEVFIRDVTALVEALENVDEIIFKEKGE